MVKEQKVSYSQACKLTGLSRNGKYYQKTMVSKDAVVKEAIESVIGTTRKGRQKVIRLVQNKHPHMGSSRIRRVYERYGFSLHRRLKRRVSHHPSNPIVVPLQAGEEWGVDFMSDALVDGRKIRTLNVIDHYNRFCVGIAVATNFPAIRVIAYLERYIEKYGKPKRIRTDNGPEFTSRRFQKWLQDKGIEWSKIPPGRPDQNAIVERFNRSYREDILDANLFSTTEDVQRLTDQWIVYYNNERPHQSLNYKTPIAYAAA
jgi:putative transposase